MVSTVLITGGSGLLALNWALAIRDQHKVILGLHERDVTLRRVESRWIDMTSVDMLARTFEAINPTLVVHTVALTNVERCEEEPALARHINVDLATNVAKVCSAYGVPLIHISTDHLFAGDKPLLDETEPPHPVNIYGRTKAEAEIRVLETHPRAVVMRTNFYGWGPSYRRSFSDTIIDALRAGKTLTLFDDAFYTPILIEEAVKAAHDLVDLKAVGIFHVGGDERISKYAFGLKIADTFKLDATLIRRGRMSERQELVRRPHDMSLSNNKLCMLLKRKLGGIKEHTTQLFQLEQNGIVQEVRIL